jgi:hypothetical protein
MQFTVAGKVARMTLNRPHALNSMPHEMVLEMDEIAAQIAADPAIRVVTVTGAGRAFSAGIDLKALSRGEIGHDYLAPWERFLHRLETMDKLVLCLLHGYFIGGGLQLALACDIRVATPPAMEEAMAVIEAKAGERVKLDEQERKRQEAAGIKTIQLPPAEAKKWSDTAKEAGWAAAMKTSPERVAKLKELLTKK